MPYMHFTTHPIRTVAAGVQTLTHQRRVIFREALNLMTAAATAWGDAVYMTLRAASLL